MGLEAESMLETEGRTHRVKALLESHELILRGDFKRTFKISDLTAVAASEGVLRFVHDGTDYTLHLLRPETWAKKLTTPPPSLASKLGISPDKPAFVIGAVDDEALQAALDGNVVGDQGRAAQIIVVAERPDDLPAAADLPVWVIYPKGAKSPLPESDVRSLMRAAGWADTKTCSVSARLTALRFNRR
jgi:hypothetical protein